MRTLSNSMRTMFTDANTQQIIPVGNSNSLIITGFGSNVASIVKMLRFVDDAAKDQGAVTPEFEVIPLEFASADEISDTLGELLEASKRDPGAPAGPAQATTSGAPCVGGRRVCGPGDELRLASMPDAYREIRKLMARLV